MLPLSRGAPLPRRSSDLPHDVDNGKVRVVTIAVVSSLPTHLVCSLSVIWGAAKTHLRAHQCPLLWWCAIPCRITVVPPTQARRGDGHKRLGSGPWRWTREGNTHVPPLRIGQTVLYPSVQTLCVKRGLPPMTSPRSTGQRREKNIVKKYVTINRI